MQTPGLCGHACGQPATRLPKSRCGTAAFKSLRATRSRPVPSAAVLVAPALAKAPELPADLANCVATLPVPNPAAPGGVTTVYLLAMSHVSKKSCDQIRELIKAVKPEVVAVELCRERVGLLYDPDHPNKAEDTWHCRKIKIEGVPEAPGFPTQAELRGLLTCRPGRPVSTSEIEGDVYTLLSTGLFKSCRPRCENATAAEAPAFTAGRGPTGGLALTLIPPLGGIGFAVEERVLPPLTQVSARLDSSLKGSAVTQEQLDAVCAAAVEANKGGSPSLRCLLGMRAQLTELLERPVALTLQGAEVGRVEAGVRAVRPGEAYSSGLESTARNGEGLGIEPFRPMRNKTFPVSAKLLLPQDALERMTRQQQMELPPATAETSDIVAALASFEPCTRYEAWSDQEVAEAQEPPVPESPVADTFVTALTMLYAKLQGDAAKKLGLNPGAAWRAALEAATEVGAQQFLLADMPADISQRHLADSMLQASQLRLGAAAAVAAAGLVAALAHVMPEPVPDSASLAAGFVGTVAVLWPLLAPYIEAAKFAGLSGEEIERAVAINEPIASGDLERPFKVWGEDALLDWPGAMQPLINERDAFMAKALAAIAAGGPNASSPGFILDRVEGQLVWRYMVPEGAPAGAAPAGTGDGRFTPLGSARSVVAVVGSAHVRGMCRSWQQHMADTDVTPLLKC